jgi:pentatricopeptide repeat protein
MVVSGFARANQVREMHGAVLRLRRRKFTPTGGALRALFDRCAWRVTVACHGD